VTLEDLIIKHEGSVPSPYTDTTGHQTVGVGHNLDASPLPGETYPMSQERILAVLAQDITNAQNALQAALPWFFTLSPVRAAVLMDMAFNMGLRTLLTFQHTLGCIEAGNWDAAAQGMLASLWAKQVGPRATEDARMMVTGLWPDDPNFHVELPSS
jgi:lysozyme